MKQNDHMISKIQLPLKEMKKLQTWKHKFNMAAMKIETTQFQGGQKDQCHQFSICPKRNMVRVQPSVPVLWCQIMNKTWWCHSEDDLWPFGDKIESLHHIILLDILVKFYHNWRMNSWVLAKYLFCEATVTLTFSLWWLKSRALIFGPHGSLCQI